MAGWIWGAGGCWCFIKFLEGGGGGDGDCCCLDGCCCWGWGWGWGWVVLCYCYIFGFSYCLFDILGGIGGYYDVYIVFYGIIFYLFGWSVVLYTFIYVFFRGLWFYLCYYSISGDLSVFVYILFYYSLVFEKLGCEAKLY